MASFANMHVWLLSVWPFELSAQRIKDVHNSWAFFASEGTSCASDRDLKTEDGSEAAVQGPALKHFPQRNRIIVDNGRRDACVTVTE